MKLDTLKAVRIGFPGTLITALGVPLFAGGLAEAFYFLRDNPIRSGSLLFSTIVFGSLYYTFKIRMFVFEPELRKINQNIKDSLTSPFVGDLFTQEEAEDMKRDPNFLTRYFYHFVDNYPSLKEKSVRVRANGAIWSSAADGVVLFGAGTVLYVIISLIEQGFWPIALICLTLALISYFSLRKLTQQHLELSNEQLRSITSDHRPELRERLRTSLSELRRT